MNKMSADKCLKIEEYLNTKDKKIYRIYRDYELGARRRIEINYGFFRERAHAENAFHIINEKEQLTTTTIIISFQL